MEEIPSSFPRVLLTPCLIGSSLVDPICLRIVEQWGKGCLVPVVSSGLLRRYLSVLSGLGIPRPLLRRWAWWFTSPEKCEFIDLPDLPQQPLIELCREISARTRLQLIIHSGRKAPNLPLLSDGLKIRWVSAAEHLAEFGK